MKKEQELAIKNVNKALKALHKSGVLICGMDCDLLYATRDVIKNCEYDGGYCEVANANKFGTEGTGKLYSDGYQDSGGF